MRNGLHVALFASLALLGPALARADEPKEPAAPAAAEDDEETRGYIGMGASPAVLLTDEDKKGLGATAGVVVTNVIPGLPAEAAGLKRGDVVEKVNGAPVPDSSGLTRDSKESETQKFWDAYKKLLAGTKPGAEVVLTVRRAGQETTIRATAVDFDTYKRLSDIAEEEASYPRLPDLASAGEAKAQAFHFEDVQEERPAGFLKFDGMWEVRTEQGAEKPNQVLLQEMFVDSWALCLVTGAGRALSDGKVIVRWKPVSGREDASAGIAFRAKDRKNYYLARANALEPNLRLYILKDGSRLQLATADVPAPEMGKWHTLEVSFQGNAFQATLDGKGSVTATDDAYASGWTGLWTKADSVTEFDDLKIEPTAPPPTK